ncbi:ABC transporter permease [Actinomadura decatromicini]|uniref:ABC transporter permease subunit n=1 Tax=Actinomadura decatromicini TaxID=2604572 RepID=A0A5D3FTE4_9ACTN|nr:ABC transporter permease subunit [Actinomadura decatromicini]TYK51354.1 ABC transporter permease subunit [Actinomadura decatromicini]
MNRATVERAGPREPAVPRRTWRAGFPARAAFLLLPPVAVGLAGVLLIQLVISRFEISGVVIPKPTDVFAVMRSDIFLEQVGQSTWETWKATLIGFALGAGSGVLLGLLMAESRIARFVLYPYVVAFQSLPKIALAPVCALWLGFGLTMKFSFAAMLAFFPAVVATLAALAAVPETRLEMAAAFHASRRQRLLRISLPSAVPGIVSGLEISMAFALIGAIVGEFVAPSAGGLGQLLLSYSESINVAAEFSVLVVLMLLGVAQNKILFGVLRAGTERFFESSR